MKSSMSYSIVRPSTVSSQLKLSHTTTTVGVPCNGSSDSTWMLMMLFVSRSGPSRSSPLPDPPLNVTVNCGEMPSFASNRCSSRPEVMLPAKSRMLSPAAMPTYGVSSESSSSANFKKTYCSSTSTSTTSASDPSSNST